MLILMSGIGRLKEKIDKLFGKLLFSAFLSLPFHFSVYFPQFVFSAELNGFFFAALLLQLLDGKINIRKMKF